MVVIVPILLTHNQRKVGAWNHSLVMCKNLIDGKDRLLKTQRDRNGLLTAGNGQLRAALHKTFEHKHVGNMLKN